MADTDEETFTSRLNHAMRLRGVTATGLEKRAKLGKGMGSRYARGERGKNPGADLAQRIADVLGVRSRWLVSGDGPMLADGEPVPEHHPNRVPVLETDAFKVAPAKVRDWFANMRLARDMATDEWRRVLDAACVLHAHGILFAQRATPRGSVGKQPEQP